MNGYEVVVVIIISMLINHDDSEDMIITCSYMFYTLLNIPLVMEALKDPLNQRFCLMSETCIPLYPFKMFRDVLLSLNKSIVNACVWGGMEGIY